MDIESLMKMWDSDCKIDQVALDESSIKGASLHSKYLEVYSVSKLRLKKKELELAILKKDKFLYYNGKMSKEEIDKNGWEHDPFNGLAKPLKSDMAMYYDSDPDMINCKLQVECIKTIVEACKEILETLKWRSQTIKNIIAWRSFEAGV